MRVGFQIAYIVAGGFDMHGHVSSVLGQGSLGASQLAAEKAASMQRSAALRRRLLREAAQLGGVPEGDAEELAAAWRQSDGGQRRIVSYYV